MKIRSNALVLALTATTLSGITSATFGSAAPVEPLAIAADATTSFSLPSGILDRVEARTNESHTLRLEAGRSFRIVVDGDGDTDLDAFLYDENDNLLDQDIDLTDFCILEVRPRWTGNFRLEIRNLGTVYNQYVLEVK